VFEQNRVPRYPRQVWFVVAMALLLVALVVMIVLDQRPGATRYAAVPTARVEAQAPTKGPTSSATIRATASSRAPVSPTIAPTVEQVVASTDEPTSTMAPTATDAPSVTPPATAAPSATGVPSPLPTETAMPSPTVPDDHFWLERPIAFDQNDRVARFYPYASRLDGSYPIHHGVEFGNPMGTPILATAAGTIIVAGDDSREVYGARSNFYGLVVIQELDQTLDGQSIYVLYGHLSEIAVKVGQSVRPGEAIGLVGMSGVAEGPHLHMEVRYGRNDYAATVNPELWVRPRQGFGSLAGAVISSEGEPLAEVKVVLYAASNPDKPVRDVITYPKTEANPDPVWRENLGTGELAAGEWVARLYHKQRLYTERVLIEEGHTTWLEIRTE